MSRFLIPFNRPCVPKNAMRYLHEAFGSWHISGNGSFTRRCQDFLSTRLLKAEVLLTTSCTDALEMCALLLDIAPGDEVILPSFTFVSTANAFVLRGAKPVFCDIRPDTLNLNENGLESLISARTKAIVVVHYAGVGCEMNAIMATAHQHGIPVIEDNAHGLFGAYCDQPLGSFGSLASLSFHETKNISCGEGGALVINDLAFGPRAEILRDKGTDRSRFSRGQVDKYTWQDLGSSFLPSDLLAALLHAQIEMVDLIQAKRRDIYLRYAAALQPWASGNGTTLPVVPAHCASSHHMFHLLLPTPTARTAFIDHLKGQDINAVFHYQPLHLTPMGRKLGGRAGQCPVAESVADRLVRLPFYYDLSDVDQDRICQAVRSFSP